MEGFMEKFGSRSSKQGTSKMLNVTEGKQRKAKKKKKSRRSSRKSELESQESVKFTSDEDRSEQNNNGVKELDRNYQEFKKRPVTEDQTVPLPLLVSGTGMSSFNTTGLTQDALVPAILSATTVKQPLSGHCSDQETVKYLADGINCLNVKQKQSSKKTRSCHISKQNSSKQSLSNSKDKTISKLAPLNEAGLSYVYNSSTVSLKFNPSQHPLKSLDQNNESLRWDCAFDNSEEEQEHIRIYKINRRKRYLADAQAKGLSWAVNTMASSSFQLSDDIGLDNLRMSTGSYADYRPMRNLGMPQLHGMMGAAIVEC